MAYVGTTKEKSDKLTQKSTNQDILRSGMIAELDATSLYQSQIENSDDELTKRVLTHIMNEEKEHTAELACVLSKHDKEQDKYFKKFLKSHNINELTCLHEED